MQTQDYQVLSTLRQWCRGDTPVWLVTVVKTLGSAPRPVGSLMACRSDGVQVGSVSGGCVEEDLLEKLRSVYYATGQVHEIEYGVSAQENERFGLPCGGRLHLLLQAIDDADALWLDSVCEALAQRRCTVRLLDSVSGQTQVDGCEQFQTLQWNGEQLEQCFGPRQRMLLVGAGHLAQSLAELAQAMDFEVLVTDPRQAVLDQWQGIEVELIQGMPDDVIRQRASDAHCVIITLTHDPRIDDMALLEALATDAWYVGALGSRRTTDKRLERLAQLGLSEQQRARLHAPVGLPIGSKTALEIAVSIMAEITQLKRGMPR